MGKQALRERVWDDLADSGAARFPFPPQGRIPNFDGADGAADRLGDLAAWTEARAVKANPDAPQLPVRRRALHAGKTVFVAAPRLRSERCFVRLDPHEVADLDAAPTVSSMDEFGVAVPPEDLPPIDLIVSGSVAVTEAGARVGKGEGYSDIEYALLRAVDRVDETTAVVTTVHERQVVDDPITPDAHDVPVDVIVTPDRVLHTETPYGRPAGIDWDRLSEDRIEEMPVLARLRS